MRAWWAYESNRNLEQKQGGSADSRNSAPGLHQALPDLDRFERQVPEKILVRTPRAVSRLASRRLQKALGARRVEIIQQRAVMQNGVLSPALGIPGYFP